MTVTIRPGKARGDAPDNAHKTQDNGYDGDKSFHIGSKIRIFCGLVKCGPFSIFVQIQ